MKNSKPMIISGAQDGVDITALEVAHSLKLLTGGFCPQKCRTETGDKPQLIGLYNLQETEDKGYIPRTKLNVQTANVTIVFMPVYSTGSLHTIGLCNTGKWGVNDKPKEDGVYRPCLLITDKSRFTKKSKKAIIDFLDKHKPKVINIAGNRESRYIGKYPKYTENLNKFLTEILTEYYD
ncbi:MAG: YpsA SLOG family protein [Candidatus Hodarchaeales archaeon]|jgi:hypothetical protein